MTGIRVISGVAKGKKLLSVPGNATRPITDRVKESLFNIIGNDIVGATMLDLFAGTGSVGIEALSRGAAFVRFNDRNQKAVETIRANLAATRLNERAEILSKNAFTLLKAPVDKRFDYVYIAPPQYQGLWEQALLSLDEYPDWLTADAWVIVQIHPNEYKPLVFKEIEEMDVRRYGSTLLVFYIRKP
ncbi:MAG: 16S rRNA (guanine(966)-N(2))-methyltransferase RsmD [Chloroflexota bacterium]